ncbi:PREDICTED: uncharacterized protein LOC109338076 [Lupinus angustifolius]|uniref:uncharacterized protein LOC109338076 n=1 Tax=Lupinus angustifolius TaxID=3871 RepID=UPI00092F1143|nr:PREDICTED: uncharacterized protein LOC109338076 [Lupinus angustifolius]
MSSLSLCLILADGKLVANNFHYWYQTLRIILMHEKLIDMIDTPVIPELVNKDDIEAVFAYNKYLEDLMSIKCLILASMSHELQRKHEDIDPTDIIAHLKKILAANLGRSYPEDVILQSLPDSFSPFIVNFNMNKMDCDLHEMLNMLIDYHNHIDYGKNQGSVLVVGKSNKKKDKWNKKSTKKPFVPKGGVTNLGTRNMVLTKAMLNVSSIRRKDTGRRIAANILII